MMNINCAFHCYFQEDGKCALTHIISASSSPHPGCAYFRPPGYDEIDTQEERPYELQ